MKGKLYTLILFPIFFSATSQSQISKGSILLGGFLSVNSTKDKAFNDRETSFHVSPAIGIATRKNTIVGGQLFYTLRDANTYTNYSTYGAGVFLRKYKVLGNGFYLFGEGNLWSNYTTNKQVIALSQGYEVYRNRSYTVAIGFNPGVSYELTKRLHLELGFGDIVSASYTWENRVGLDNATAQNRKTSGFSISSDLSLKSINFLEFGVRFLLNGSGS